MHGSSSRPRVIAQIRGGLGNQLFCYAAARRLALANRAELILDTVTGFSLDRQYKRTYLLHHFNIVGRAARPMERSEPLGRLRRSLQRRAAQHRPFAQRRYIAQEGVAFDSRLLDVRVDRSVYLEGYWQSEQYFDDIEGTIRQDFELKRAPNDDNRVLAERMRNCASVAIHVRWFNDSRAPEQAHNIPREYYGRALDLIVSGIEDPQFFVFSDDLAAAENLRVLPVARTQYVDVNRGRSEPHLDLWLMSQCRHFVIANSTFSWWAAWLATAEGKTVVAPAFELEGMTAWGFAGLLPPAWKAIDLPSAAES